MHKTTYFVHYPLRPGPNQIPILTLENSGEIATFVKDFYPINGKDCVEVMLLGKERHPDALIKARGLDYNDTESFRLFAEHIAEKAEELIPGGDVVLLRDSGKRDHLDAHDIRLNLELHETLGPKGLDLRDCIILDHGGYISSCGDGKKRYPNKVLEEKPRPVKPEATPWQPTKTQIEALIEVMNKSRFTDDDAPMNITNELLEQLQAVWAGEAAAHVYIPDARYQPHRDALKKIRDLARKQKDSDFAREVERLCMNAEYSVEDREPPVRHYVQIDGSDPRNPKFTDRLIKRHRLDRRSTKEIKSRELLIPYAQAGGASTDRVNVSDDSILEVIEGNRLVGLQYLRRDDLNYTEVTEIDLRTLFEIFKSDKK